jgi:hypothetical protein
MKARLFLVGSLLCASAVTGFGQQEEEGRFKAGEIDLSPFATYVDKEGDNWGAGASATYFLSERLGLGASTYWTDFEGSFIDNLEGEGYFRLPVLKVVAPYAVAGIGYEFETEEWFETLGAGVDFRPLKNLSAFGDLQYRFAGETKDGVFARLGVRFAL